MISGKFKKKTYRNGKIKGERKSEVNIKYKKCVKVRARLKRKNNIFI